MGDRNDTSTAWQPPARIVRVVLPEEVLRKMWREEYERQQATPRQGKDR